MELEEFINRNKKRQNTSIFDNYQEDIKKLLELKFSQESIIEYLKTKKENKKKKGLTQANLSLYLKKQRDSKKEDTNEKQDMENIELLKRNAFEYNKIYKYYISIRKKYLSIEEQKEVTSVISLIDFFVKNRSFNTSVLEEEKSSDNSIEGNSYFSQIANMGKDKIN